MKKMILMLAAVFTFSTALVSCRDTEGDVEEVELDTYDDNLDDDDDLDMNDENLNEDGVFEDEDMETDDVLNDESGI